MLFCFGIMFCHIVLLCYLVSSSCFILSFCFVIFFCFIILFCSVILFCFIISFCSVILFCLVSVVGTWWCYILSSSDFLDTCKLYSRRLPLISVKLDTCKLYSRRLSLISVKLYTRMFYSRRLSLISVVRNTDNDNRGFRQLFSIIFFFCSSYIIFCSLICTRTLILNTTIIDRFAFKQWTYYVNFFL